MKKIILTSLLFLFTVNVNAIVDFSTYFIIPHSVEPSCKGEIYFKVGFHTNFEVNNLKFQIQRSQDPNFSSATTGTPVFDGNIDGCGTCGPRTYSTLDYGPFNPGEVWYYRVKATSNNLNVTYYELGSSGNAAPILIGTPTIVDWKSQVTHTVDVGSSPLTSSSYQWEEETIRKKQGVSVSLMETEISNLYIECNNNKINFNVQNITPFFNLEYNVDNSGYNTLYTGNGKTSHIWENSSDIFNQVGDYILKVRFTDQSGQIFYRVYDVHVVPKSDELYLDNYCNFMRVWKSDPNKKGVPIVFSEGIDQYNVRTQQFYIYTGGNLTKCLNDKGFDIYIIDYNYNSQSIARNAAIYQSAARYVSGINSNELVVAMGMSMGGVICRYACAKAEHDGTPLPISKLVSLDAPQQGAVISKTFQDWRKDQFDENPDPYGEHNFNNTATKELLNYSAWDPLGTVHDNFYNTLNSLNGDGYPHLVESIGVAFSNNSPNNADGKWLEVRFSGDLTFIPDAEFVLSSEEKLAGSYLPPIKRDQEPVIASVPGQSLLLSLLRPFTDPTVEIIQSNDPTFIPYNSALDIVNGQSKFDITINSSSANFHDVLPSDIIEPLVNEIIKSTVYVQNVEYFNNKTIVARDFIFAGYSVTNNLNYGDVNVNDGADITFRAGQAISLKPGFNVYQGGVFTAEIDKVYCDGNQVSQEKSMTNDDNSQALQNIEKRGDKVTFEDNSNQSLSKEQNEIIFNTYPNPAQNYLNILLSVF